MLSKGCDNVKNVISKLPKWFLFLQGVPYLCMFIEMIELILESNIFNMNINGVFVTTIWCFYCAYCVHAVGIISVVFSVFALIMNFKIKASRKKYVIYTIVHILMAWFTWFWFNALMSV